MPSKDQRPSQRLGKSNPRRVKIITWTIALALFGGGAVAAYRYTGTTEVEVPVARVRRGEFIISVRTRGDIKSARSVILKAPQVPGLRIVHLAESGRPVKKGDVVVEFDGSQQDQNVISRTTTVRAADGDIVQTKATQKIDDEADSMSKMSSEYDLERSKLDASKAEVLSAIEGEKNRIQVGVSEGSLQTVKASINAHQVGQEADLGRLNAAQRQGRPRSEYRAGLSGHDAAEGAESTASSTCCRTSARRVRSARRRRPSRKATTRGPARRSLRSPIFPKCSWTSSWKKWTAAS